MALVNNRGKPPFCLSIGLFVLVLVCVRLIHLRVIKLFLPRIFNSSFSSRTDSDLVSGLASAFSAVVFFISNADFPTGHRIGGSLGPINAAGAENFDWIQCSCCFVLYFKSGVRADDLFSW